jgi:hypothetical protein
MMKTHFILIFIGVCAFIATSCTSRTQEKKEDPNTNTSAVIHSFSFDLEKASSGTIVTEAAHSGSYSCKVAGQGNYSNTEIFMIKDLNYSKISKVKLSVWYYPLENNVDASYVFNVRDTVAKKDICWKPIYIKGENVTPKQWYHLEGEIPVTKEEMSPNYIAQVYVWNGKGGAFLIDDLKVEMY